VEFYLGNVSSDMAIRIVVIIIAPLVGAVLAAIIFKAIFLVKEEE